MDQAAPEPSLDTVFAGSSFTVRGIYERLVEAMQPFGPMTEQPETNGVSITAGDRSFANTLPHGDTLLVDIRSGRAIASGRMRRIARDEGGAFRNELLLASVNDVDEELLTWLRHAYDEAVARPQAEGRPVALS